MDPFIFLKWDETLAKGGLEKKFDLKIKEVGKFILSFKTCDFCRSSNALMRPLDMNMITLV